MRDKIKTRKQKLKRLVLKDLYFAAPQEKRELLKEGFRKPIKKNGAELKVSSYTKLGYDIVAMIDKLLSKHHIPYWIWGGYGWDAILKQGCRRNHDDIDGCILRSDAIRLKNILLKAGFKLNPLPQLTIPLSEVLVFKFGRFKKVLFLLIREDTNYHSMVNKHYFINSYEDDFRIPVELLFQKRKKYSVVVDNKKYKYYCWPPELAYQFTISWRRYFCRPNTSYWQAVKKVQGKHGFKKRFQDLVAVLDQVAFKYLDKLKKQGLGMRKELK